MVNENEFDLLPANIGLENVGINGLINDYNVQVIQQNKIVKAAGKNNPVILSLNFLAE